MRVGVLASGTGTILQALLDRDVPVVVVVADRPCRALEIAEARGIAAELVEYVAEKAKPETPEES